MQSNSQKIKLSIITVNKNNAAGLERTIQSVINQTFKDFEYIIIDGASTDGSVEVIKKYEDKIDYWVSEPDTGIYNAMNKGIRVAKGEYLYFLNSGDTLCVDSILEEIFINNLTADIIYGNVLMIKTKKIYNGKFNNYKLMWKNIPHQAIFYNKKIIKIFGFYKEKYKIRADWEYNIRIFTSKNIKIKYVNKIFACYEQGGISEKLSDEVFFKDRILIYKNFSFLLRQIFKYHKYFPFSFIHKLLISY